MIEYLRNCTINGNCNVDKPKRKFNCSLKPLYKNAPLHIYVYNLVRIARSAHSFFSHIRWFDSSSVFSMKYHMNVCLCIWIRRRISVSVLLVRLLACLAAFLSHVSWAVPFFYFSRVFHFSSAGQWQCFIDRLSTCIAHCVYATQHTISMKVTHKHIFIRFVRPESMHGEKKKYALTHTPHSYIYAKLK